MPEPLQAVDTCKAKAVFFRYGLGLWVSVALIECPLSVFLLYDKTFSVQILSPVFELLTHMHTWVSALLLLMMDGWTVTIFDNTD